jgi:ArsR family transcriptional regulator
MDYRNYADVFRALSDEKRLQILEILHGGERCANELLAQLDIGQSTLSYHMKILCRSGIVSGREDGKWTYYRINEEGSANACRILHSLTILCPEEKENRSPEAGEGCKKDTILR